MISLGPRLRRLRTTCFPVPALTLILILCCGCAGKVETTRSEPGFDGNGLRRGGVGLGGVVLAAQLATAPGATPPLDAARDEPMAQSDSWAPTLYSSLLARAGTATLWPWPAVRDACGDSVLTVALAALARGNTLGAAELKPLADCIEHVRYLAVARIEGDELSIEELGPGNTVNPRVQASRDPHAPQREGTVKTRRRVAVTLEVYDLRQGGLAWSATARRHRDELYDFNAASAERKPGVVPEGEPVITVAGRSVPAPGFAPVFADACAALAERLLGDSAP